jgi:hypothetical protein
VAPVAAPDLHDQIIGLGLASDDVLGAAEVVDTLATPMLAAAITVFKL